MKTRELQEKLVSDLQRWQKIETEAVASTGKIIERSENPTIQLIMEIVQRDSQTHARVQQTIIDSIEREAISLTPEQLAAISEMVEAHIELEHRTVEAAKETLATIEGRGMLVQHYLLSYLLEDERKHLTMLERLDALKEGIYPYA